MYIVTFFITFMLWPTLNTHKSGQDGTSHLIWMTTIYINTSLNLYEYEKGWDALMEYYYEVFQNSRINMTFYFRNYCFQTNNVSKSVCLCFRSWQNPCPTTRGNQISFRAIKNIHYHVRSGKCIHKRCMPNLCMYGVHSGNCQASYFAMVRARLGK